MKLDQLASTIRNVPDWPKPGIQFKDITTLLKDPSAFRLAVDEIATRFRAAGVKKVAGIEARGFIFGAGVAYKLGAAFVPVRKPKKLPAATFTQEYQLEYGTDRVEMHRDALEAGDRVLVVDDLLATGGTASATCKLIEQAGGKVCACAFVIELSFLSGRSRLDGREVYSLVQFSE